MAASCAYDVVATVPSGLERSAAKECRETLGPGREVLAHRGSISCPLERSEELSKVSSSARVCITICGIRSLDTRDDVQ